MVEAGAEHWQLWVDGTAWPNPGKIGLGIILRSPDGQDQHHSIPLGRSGCNNEAELCALFRGLEAAKAAGADNLLVISDSDFAVRHSRGELHTHSRHLQLLADQVRALMAGFADVRLQWVPRHRNTEADGLARGALGLALKPAIKPNGRRQK